MTRVTISLEDDLAARARAAGLLSDESIGDLLEQAIRRQAARELLDASASLQAAGIPRLSEDEIVAEVKASRAERKQI